MQKKNNIQPLFFIALLFCASVASAQQDSTATIRPIKKSDPKIGLVLSGGGAKGLAHIGALKVIDSLGIEVDYVAGTSMGAIVGSLYASGYTGQQLDSIFQTINFDNIISDDIPRKAKTFYERRENERYAVTLPFKDFSVQLPSSLSKGQNIYNLLSRLLSNVKSIDNFENLPIPFFCIATDVTTGEEVVLDSGYLPRAVNASGALPSLFAPVEIDGRLLIDGGVTDNYPVEKLRAKGMDIIIGVDVQDDLRTLDELNGALDILTQINNFRTIHDMEQKIPKTDIYIAPDISEFSVVSFDQGNKIIQRGFTATSKKINQLKAYRQRNYQKPELTNIAQDSIYLKYLDITGNENYSRSFIKGRFKIKTPGMVAYEDINNGINNLQATNNFKKINYEILEKKVGTVLEIRVEESDVRNYLRLGLHYDELLRSAALVNLSRKNVLFDNDIVSADFIVGDNIRYNFDYYIDKGRYWSIGLHSEFVKFEQDIRASLVEDINNSVPLGVNSIEIQYRDWTQQFYLQTSLAKSFNLVAGAEIKSLTAFTETLETNDLENDRTYFSDGTLGSIYGKILLDSYDNAQFPNSGWWVQTDFHLYLFNTEFGDDFNEFSIAQIEVGRAISAGKWTLALDAMLGISIGQHNNSSLDFYLGGYGARRINNIVPFYGYDFISLGGDTMLNAGAEIDYEIFKKNHLSFGFNLANVSDDLFERRDWFTQAQYVGYALGYGIETFLGPIKLKYSFSPQQDDGQFFVQLGYRF
ncbi:patatin-like phospholipase family protein [Nonlabens xiamenensis]|uniref:patatin-like phospholipase family protein n=1 Tax=Nonlabens xiamenensis TaxID=2341043 RepID=UPI000F613650|nr:patatin-like phospholipase family protein [Nonlabens xiamenensis]